jgi:aldehyde:ferredoxin oxidoreductase
LKGYCGKLLRVDLSSGLFLEIPLDPGVARTFVGGSGLAAHLFLEEIAPAARRVAETDGTALLGPAGRGYPDPLGPENPLILATGPLTGTRIPCAPRFTVSARSPLTGIWGEANVGGFFGPELKFAGYDAVVVTGRAPAPVYLLIDRGTPSLKPAADLWGRDTYETNDLLVERHGPAGPADTADTAQGGDAPAERLRRPQVLAIGPAGENLVRFASAIHGKHHAAGRTGMGAVMGAKNLKAVVVRGAGGLGGPAGAFPLADPDGIKDLAAVFVARAKENMVTRSLGEAGTIMGMDIGALIGDVPIRNWSLGAWGDELEKVGVGGYESHLTSTGTCFLCPVRCKRKVTVEALGHSLVEAAGSEYETLGLLGPNLLISDLPALLVAGEVANRLGIDTITAGGTLAYAYEAADRGLLDGVVGPADPKAGSAAVEALKGAWGDATRMVGLLGDIAYRRGVGNDLADGSAILARRIGRPEALEFLSTVKGLEAPAHDVRAVHGMAVAYATSTRGACHMNSLMYGAEHAGVSAPEAGLESDGRQQSSAGKGLLNKAAQDLGSVFGQAAVLCQLGGNMYTGHELVAMLNAVTGFGYTLDEVLECGARIWHLKRGIGALYGLGPEDDRLPPRLLSPLDEGGAAGAVPDLEGMLSEWYEARGIDPQTGLAKPEALKGLGLSRLAGLLGDGRA